MRRFLTGLALGAAAGLAVGRLPKVKQAITKGRKKIKELTK